MNINKIFFSSLISGITIWLFVFLILPVSIVDTIEIKTIVFIVINYISLILGFLSVNFSMSNTKKININYSKLINIIIAVVFFSFLLRFIDLFFIRDLSFTNSINENRQLNDTNFGKSNFAFFIGSILKGLYFFPLVMIFSIKEKQNKITVLLAGLLMFFPVVEAVLKGTRKPFIELFLILIVAILLFKKIKIDFKKITLMLLGVFAVFYISNTILFQREAQKEYTQNTYTQLLNARYTKLIPANSKIVKFIENPKQSDFKRKTVFTFLHFGQYYTHGFFEFNHIIKNKNLPVAYGQYTFVTIPKFLQKLNILPSKKALVTPRGSVYITAFGGLYFDYRWFSVVCMFLFGIFQKLVFQKSVESAFWKPLLVYIVIINLLLCVINYIRGSGIYPLVGFGILLVTLSILKKYYFKSYKSK